MSHMRLRKVGPITIFSAAKDTILVILYLIVSEPIRFAQDMGLQKWDVPLQKLHP